MVILGNSNGKPGFPSVPDLKSSVRFAIGSTVPSFWVFQLALRPFRQKWTCWASGNSHQSAPRHWAQCRPSYIIIFFPLQYLIVLLHFGVDKVLQLFVYFAVVFVFIFFCQVQA